MPRAKSSVVSRKRHKKVLKLAKGYRGAKSNYTVLQPAGEVPGHAIVTAGLKSDFRKLWIARINAAARMNGIFTAG